MCEKKHSILVGLFALLYSFVFYPSICFSELTNEGAVKKEIEKRMVGKEIIILPQLNKITTGFGKQLSRNLKSNTLFTEG